MIVSVFKRLGLLLRNPVLQRAVLAVCILSFVATNFAHAGPYGDNCLGKPAAAVETTADADADSPGKAAPDLDICPGCHVAAMPLTLAYVAMPDRVAATKSSVSRGLLSRVPQTDLRPPIA